MPELSVVTDPNLPEPKGISTASANKVYMSDGEGGGSWVSLNHSGYVAVGNTLASQPLTQNVWLKLANDGLSPQSDDSFIPVGMTSPWDPVANQIDLAGAGFTIGDQLSIRVDTNFTTTSNNDKIGLRLVFAAGELEEFFLVILDTTVKTLGTVNETVYTGFYVGSSAILDNPIEVQAFTDGAGNSVGVNGWYIKMEPRSLVGV